MSDAVIRVLVVDASAFARKILREALTTSPRIQVVDTARDGLDALTKIEEISPDVVVLDLVMPSLDGLGVLRSMPKDNPPDVIVVSGSPAQSAAAIEALHTGAFDIAQKPAALPALASDQLVRDLVSKVITAADARRKRARGAASPMPAPAPASIGDKPKPVKLVVVGAGAGGPLALTRLLGALPGDFPVPLAIAQRLPEGFTGALAERLDRTCAIDVREIKSILDLRPRLAALGRSGTQVAIRRNGIQLTAEAQTPTGEGYAPSVNALFAGAAAALGAGVLGVVLTGAGADGVEGAQAIRAAGGSVFTESTSSCLVDAMPRAVRDAGLSQAEGTLTALADLIRRRLAGGHAP